MEIWKEIAGNPGYEVSVTGQVRHGEYILSQRNVSQSRKYLAVRLLGGKEHYVHRLVAQAFIGTIPKGWQVNHLDGDPTNNNLSNLEIVTPKQNTMHALWPTWYSTQTKIPFFNQ